MIPNVTYERLVLTVNHKFLSISFEIFLANRIHGLRITALGNKRVNVPQSVRAGLHHLLFSNGQRVHTQHSAAKTRSQALNT